MVTAEGVGEEHQVGILGDYQLSRHLRVPGPVIGVVRDVGKPEHGVQRANEGARRGRVQRRIDLVVVGGAPRLGIGHDPFDVVLHRGDQRRCTRQVAGGSAKLLDLRVGIVKVDGRPVDDDGDADRLQSGHGLAAGVEHHHHQIGVESGDGLDVRLEAAQLARRRLGRIVGLVVDGDHLVAGID